MNNWEKNVRKVEPYTPGEQPKESGIIKLNTNENPYPPSPKVTEVMKNFDTDNLRKYPDPGISILCEAISERYGVNKNQVFVGVGSDDVIAMSFLAFFNSGKPVFFPDITYSFYDVWANLYNIPFERKALDKDMHIKKEDYYGENGGIIFPNPNAPTGLMEDLKDVEDIVKNNPDVVVIVDEAYIDFGGVSALPLVEKYENLLVVQTFSKSRSMAGMRIGYAFGSEKLIKYLNDVKYSFNSYTLTNLAIETGSAAVRDDEYFRKTCESIISTREAAKVRLKELGFSFPDSKANFIFATHKSAYAGDIFEALKKKHIYVRYFNKPLIDNYLRITIGTPEEMERLYEALAEIVG
ncbi:MAG: histidinol-phosphate transaminase [Eubacterium sp.]|nr:histidinol-phosphate transaminase [Eubacterium sp.]